MVFSFVKFAHVLFSGKTDLTRSVARPARPPARPRSLARSLPPSLRLSLTRFKSGALSEDLRVLDLTTDSGITLEKKEKKTHSDYALACLLDYLLDSCCNNFAVVVL